jgi:hypothetical protein
MPDFLAQRYRMIIVFEGSMDVDRGEVQAIDALIAKYEESNRIKLHYKKNFFGLEGEHVHCYKLRELSNLDGTSLILEVQKTIQSGTISIKENEKCPGVERH